MYSMHSCVLLLEQEVASIVFDGLSNSTSGCRSISISSDDVSCVYNFATIMTTIIDEKWKKQKQSKCKFI